MYKKFKKMCKMTQEELKQYIVTQFKTNGYEIEVDDGYIFKSGMFPVLLVAHLDTVHLMQPNIIKNENGILSSSNGIGGDDRCGVFMILEIIKKYDCSVLFCEDEEIGCVGARQFTKTDLCKSLKGKFQYIIELDRKGKNDAVFYECDNPDFTAFITKEYWKRDMGSCSDISYVAPALETAAVNLSCGYYKQHTKEEYVVMDEMYNNIKEVQKLLARTTDDDKYEYIEEEVYWSKWTNDRFYDSYFTCYVVNFIEGNEQKMEIVDGDSPEEALGVFFMENRKICFDDIISVEDENGYVVI